jgi:hypothetical protein
MPGMNRFVKLIATDKTSIQWFTDPDLGNHCSTVLPGCSHGLLAAAVDMQLHACGFWAQGCYEASFRGRACYMQSSTVCHAS